MNPKLYKTEKVKSGRPCNLRKSAKLGWVPSWMRK